MFSAFLYNMFFFFYLGGNNKSSMGSYGSSSYKILPDVEISKTNPNHSAEVLRREDVMKHLVEHGSISASNAGTTSTDNNRKYLNKSNPAAVLSQPQVSVRQDLVDNDPVKREAPQNHQQMVSPAIAAAAAAMSANFHQNGLVTLSKYVSGHLKLFVPLKYLNTSKKLSYNILTFCY